MDRRHSATASLRWRPRAASPMSRRRIAPPARRPSRQDRSEDEPPDRRQGAKGGADDEQKAFGAYRAHGIQAPVEELKTLTVSSDPQGGYLAPAEISSEFIRDLRRILADPLARVGPHHLLFCGELSQAYRRHECQVEGRDAGPGRLLSRALGRSGNPDPGSEHLCRREQPAPRR